MTLNLYSIHYNSKGEPDFVVHSRMGPSRSHTTYFVPHPSTTEPYNFLCLTAGKNKNKNDHPVVSRTKKDLPEEVKRIFDMGEHTPQMFLDDRDNVVARSEDLKNNWVWRHIEGKPLHPRGEPLRYLKTLEDAAGCEVFRD
jgi:hypothetical protein